MVFAVGEATPAVRVRPRRQRLLDVPQQVSTRLLGLAAETLQPKVIDHRIVSRDAVFSFPVEGLL